MKTTVRKINQALRETNWCLYLIGSHENSRIRTAMQGKLFLVNGQKLEITDSMRFLDGRSGQEVSL